MSNTAAKKWAAARTLHEGWQAPLELLNRVLGHQPGAAERRCIAENWKSITSVARLRERLIEVFESQLDQFGSAGGELDLEKSSRAISVLAKMLEIIVASDALTENLGGAEQRASSPATHRKAKIDDLAPPSSTASTAELDRQLTALVGNLVQERSIGRPAEDSER